MPFLHCSLETLQVQFPHQWKMGCEAVPNDFFVLQSHQSAFTALTAAGAAMGGCWELAYVA